MGYHAETVNVFGFTLSEEELNEVEGVEDDTDPFENSKYHWIFIGGFNGADSRIHIDQFLNAVVMRDYSWSSSKSDGLNGDTSNTPTEAEISEFREFCLKNNIPWKAPERISRTYTI